MKKDALYLLIALLLVSFGCGLAFIDDAWAQIDVSFGSEYVFNPATTDHIAVAKLSTNKVVIAYKDIGGSGYGRAVIATVTDKSISYGAEYLFNSAATNYISVTALSENSFAIAFRDIGNNNYGTVIIGSVNGSSISYGAEYVFNTAKTEYINAVALSSDTFVVLYRDASNSDLGTAIVATVNNNTVSFGNEYIFNPSKTSYVAAAKLSDSSVVVAFKDSDGLAKATIGEVLNTSISFGSEYIYNSANTEHISVSSLDASKIVVGYRDIGGLGYGQTIIGQIDNQVIDYGSEYTFNNSATYYTSVEALTDKRFIVSYKDGIGTGYGTLTIGDIDDTTVSYSPEFVFNSSQTATTTAVSLTANRFLIIYIDSGSSDQGTAIIGQIEAICGDSIIDENEECDDGNTIDGDSCSALCALESVCGNNVLENGEECDDGNTADEDGCSAICEIEEPEPDPPIDPPIETPIFDGDLIKNPNAEGMAQFDIYIVKLVNGKMFKRLILSPHVFESYGHFDKNENGSPWDDVVDVDEATMNQYTDSDLVRAYDPNQGLDDSKVYKLIPQGDSGTKNWLGLNTEEFEAQGYDWDSIYLINQTDRDAYTTGDKISS